MEKWKPVLEYEEYYEVSNLGRIRCLSGNFKGRIRSPKVNRNGYLSVALTKKGERKTFNLHRIGYAAFHGKLEIDDLIHHQDEDKLNNRLKNLRKTTRSKHKQIHASIGESTRFKQKYFFNKKEIINLYENHSTTEIAKLKNCHPKTIERFIKRHAGSLYNRYKHSSRNNH